MVRLYILKADIPVEVDDIDEWRTFMDSEDGDGNEQRILGREHVGNTFISTVFLGMDHSKSLNGPPLVFETKIFGGDYDGLMERYHTFNEAMAGHKRIKKSLKVSK